MLIRDAQPADAQACAGIYRGYVIDTAATFETTPPSVADVAGRIENSQRRHAWLVAEHDGVVVGYAYGGPYAVRAAYRWTCEVSVYLDPGYRGRGTGRALYAALLPRLRDLGLFTAVARMTLPNDASLALHRSFGFEPVGTYRAVGYKLGAWRDVMSLQLALRPPTTAP